MFPVFGILDNDITIGGNESESSFSFAGVIIAIFIMLASLLTCKVLESRQHKESKKTTTSSDIGKRRPSEPNKKFARSLLNDGEPPRTSFRIDSFKQWGDESNGKAVQIINIRVDPDSQNRSFELNIKALEDILLCEDWKEKKVAVLSVAGVFRKGKSFLLNFLLRYINAHGQPGWLKNTDLSIHGFPWCGGADRHTIGIWLWSKPFKCTTTSGEEVAFFLMDTQGTFDSNSTMKENSTVFALSTLVSSVQVLNVSQNIQENDLQTLQLFTEYARIADKEKKSITKFQRLEILVRDWSCPYEMPYGPDGGKTLLERRLMRVEGQHNELRQVRQHINTCFKEIGCFLMPHPGSTVAASDTLNLSLTDIDQLFKEQLTYLAPYLLGLDKIQIKTIFDDEINCSQLLKCTKIFVDIFNKSNLPEPRSIFNALAESGHLMALDDALAFYNRKMNETLHDPVPVQPTEPTGFIGSIKAKIVNTVTSIKNYKSARPLTEGELNTAHNKYEKKAKQRFEKQKKFGTLDTKKRYEKLLDSNLKKAFGEFQKLNETRQHVMFWKDTTKTAIYTGLGFSIAKVLPFKR